MVQLPLPSAYEEHFFLNCISPSKDIDCLTDISLGKFYSSNNPVLAPCTAQGIIDLLSIDKDGATIIDYKYSSLDSQSLKTKYHKQLELYAHATKKVLDIKVKKMTVVNLFTGETIDI